MQARCPFCANVFPAAHSGVQFCPACGKQINVPEPAPAAAAPAPQGTACPRHPDRAAIGACARCGTYGCSECISGGLCPACRPQAGAAFREPTPWERRAQLGLVGGLVQTVKQTVSTPGAFWGSVDPKGSTLDAFLYGWLITSIGAVFTLLMSLINFGGYQAMIERLLESTNQLDPDAQRAMGWLAEHPGSLGTGTFFFTVVFYPLTFLIGAAIIHLGCLLFGAAKNGFGATARVVGYSTVPALLGWIPLVGGLFTMLIVVLEIFGIQKVQETTAGRAVGGVLLLPAVGLCCLCGAGASLAAFGLSQFK